MNFSPGFLWKKIIPGRKTLNKARGQSYDQMKCHRTECLVVKQEHRYVNSCKSNQGQGKNSFLILIYLPASGVLVMICGIFHQGTRICQLWREDFQSHHTQTSGVMWHRDSAVAEMKCKPRHLQHWVKCSSSKTPIA